MYYSNALATPTVVGTTGQRITGRFSSRSKDGGARATRQSLLGGVTRNVVPTTAIASAYAG